jgi:DNA-binding transcriptional LysR family regulator
MRYLHHNEVVILQLRSFLVVIEEGSLHRAATRLNLSQSALSRQMQALEHELGGKLLERSSTGVRPTVGGHALAAKIGALLGIYDSAMLEIRRLVRGQSEEIRIGYLASAFEEYLAPALKKLRKVHPRTKVKLLDLFPGEQITALRKGEIDIGLTLETGALLGRDFYTRKLAVDKSVVFLPQGHPLASRKELRLAELKNETFVMGPDDHVPGARRQLIRICRRCGNFQPRLINVTAAEDVSRVLALVAKEDAVTLAPAFLRRCKALDAAVIPVTDTGATWNLFLVWQRGQITEALRTLLNALPFQAQNSE